MCIVVVSPKGEQFPSIENIQNCVDSNPDGFAIAWNEDGEVKNYKTMGHRAIMKFYRKFIKTHDYMTTGMVFHARIATHGSLKITNCHCWISDGVAFAHNGVLSVKNRGDMTDSETFFQDIFLPIFRTHGWDSARLAIDACIGSSKFAFIDGAGDVYGFGDYKKSDGNYYSNYSYISYRSKWTPKTTSPTTTRKTSGSALDDFKDTSYYRYLREYVYDNDETDWDY